MHFSKKLLVNLLCLLMVFSMVACGSGTTGKADGNGKKDTLVVTLEEDIESMSPSEGTGFPHFQVVRQIFEPLVYYDRDMKLQPCLAESWEWKDPTTLVFHLRKGVKFSDGSEFKADDVLFTAKYSIDKKTVAFANFRAIDIDKSSAPDDYTVEFVLTSPQPNQVELLESPLCGIFNKAAFEKNDGKFNTVACLVGTGPYIATEYKAGDSFSMKKNENYWNQDPDMKPKIENILFRIVKDPAGLTILAETGDADIVTGIPATDVARIKENKNINFITALGTNTCYLCFNEKHPPLDNPKVREAIWYAIDREGVVKSAYKGIGKVADGLFSPNLGGRHPDLSKYFVKQDVEKAKALLAEAGYKDGGGIKLNIITGSPYERVNMSEAIQAQLAEVGIEVNVMNLPDAPFSQAIANGESDLATYGFSATTFEVGRNLVRWLPDSTDITLFGYEDPEYTEIVTKAMRTVDQNERYELFYKAQEMLMESRVALPLWSNEMNAALQKNVKGFYLSRSYMDHLMQTVYFEE